jgi:hypothetical protein
MSQLNSTEMTVRVGNHSHALTEGQRAAASASNLGPWTWIRSRQKRSFKTSQNATISRTRHAWTVTTPIHNGHQVNARVTFPCVSSVIPPKLVSQYSSACNALVCTEGLGCTSGEFVNLCALSTQSHATIAS